jgi:hypothetical protein
LESSDLNRNAEDQPVDGPLCGVKYGAVVRVDGTLRFSATTRRAQHSPCYDVEASAVCQLGMDHRAPAWSCTCGFYVMPDEESLAETWGDARQAHWALLKVEISGRVVEHERGWRAARQVVVEALWDDRCQRCNRARADGFGFIGSRPGPLVPLCRSCAGRTLWSVGEVSGRLGTDIRLRPAPLDVVKTLREESLQRRRRIRVLAGRLTILLGCGVGVASVAAVAAHGTPASRSPLADELAPFVAPQDPRRTATDLQGHFGPTSDRTAIVLADRSLTAPDSGQQSVGAIAVAHKDHAPDGSYLCEIIFVRGRPDPSTWLKVERTVPAPEPDSCGAEAVALRTPEPVSTTTATGSASPVPGAPAPGAPAAGGATTGGGTTSAPPTAPASAPPPSSAATGSASAPGARPDERSLDG